MFHPKKNNKKKHPKTEQKKNKGQLFFRKNNNHFLRNLEFVWLQFAFACAASKRTILFNIQHTHTTTHTITFSMISRSRTEYKINDNEKNHCTVEAISLTPSF